jgi:hypothetical protein
LSVPHELLSFPVLAICSMLLMFSFLLTCVYTFTKVFCPWPSSNGPFLLKPSYSLLPHLELGAITSYFVFCKHFFCSIIAFLALLQCVCLGGCTCVFYILEPGVVESTQHVCSK